MSDSARYLKPKPQSFCNFVYNSEKGEVLGRTGTSWAKIGIFYVVYYSLLACFFAALFTVFYTTLDPVNQPKYVYGGSLLRNPALGFRPGPSAENIESTMIWYESGDPEKIKPWADQLTNFTKPYNDGYASPSDVRNCTFEEYYDEKRQRDSAEDSPPLKPCRFSASWLGKDNTNQQENFCSSAKQWGYNDRSPCVLLKLNKIMGWEPEVYTKESEFQDDMPQSLRDHITGDLSSGMIRPMVWVSCEGEYPSDKEHMGQITMYPHHGFPAYYFPYQKNEHYRSPLLAVQFNNPTPKVLINIECRIWTKDVVYDRKNRLGLVHFEILMD